MIRKIRFFPVFIMTIALGVVLSPNGAQAIKLDDVVKSVQKAVGSGGELSESKIVSGLKEALEVGTGNAVGVVSAVGGYYNNSDIKIPLPKTVRKVEKLIRAAGYDEELDAFEMSMNNAAEQAAPAAKPIFMDAIKQMTFDDAKKILNGRENEATLYFKDKTFDRLHEIFKPKVHSAMSEVGVTNKYQALDDKVRSVPLVGNIGFDLDKYVTDGGLEGLFYMLAQEEKKIRENPAARVTDLLKEVFGRK